MQLAFKIDSNEIGQNSSPLLKWSRDSKMIACFGNNNSVSIYERSGSKVATIPVANPIFMDWNHDSKLLIIASKGHNELSLYDLQQREVYPIEAPFEPTWISFSRSGSFLVVGSEKGKYWIWEKQSQESQTYQGIHCDKITDGVWNAKRQFALCSVDHSISVNNIRGEVIARHEIDDTPAFPHFIKIGSDFALVFAAQNKPVLYIWEYCNGDNLTEIPFTQEYGTIIKCLTLSNGKIFLQFSTGKFSLVDFDGTIVAERQVFTSTAKKADVLHTKALVCSDNSMKLIQMDDPSNITDEQVRFPSEASGDASCVLISPDGTLGAVGVSNGLAYIYLLEIPILTASNGSISMYAESLSSVTVYDMFKKKKKVINIESQPQKMGVCSTKIAIAFNNQCWFYDISNGSLLTKIEFSSSVDEVQVSDTAFAVFMGGKVLLNYFDSSKKSFTYPDSDINSKITAFSLSEYLLVIATDDGALRIFNTQNQTFLEGYKHDCAIISITANISKTRLVFIDINSDVFIFNPVKMTVLTSCDSSENITKIHGTTTLFDVTDRNVFAVIGSKSAAIYYFTDQNAKGPQLVHLCSSTISIMRSPLGLHSGSLIFLDGQSNEQTQLMPSHSEIDKVSEAAINQLLTLHRHRKALQIAVQLNDQNLIRKVGESALNSLSIEIAAEAFARCGDGSMYNILAPMRNEEEYSFLRGYVSMMDHDFSAAQKNFLDSTRPSMALDMRSALLQFDFALKLAENLDPSKIPKLSFDSARQNELTGNYSAAIKQYKDSIKVKELAHASRAGIIRCLFLAGKVEQGVQQIAKTHDSKLILECARILERMSAYGPAAAQYIRVNEWNSAAQCHLRANELKEAAALIQKIDDQKVLRSIGLQLERAGQLESATAAFEKANDWESLVRVLLKVNLDRATAVAREHPLISVCRLVAEHCIQLGNFRFAIEFLIRSGKAEDAFRIAELHDKMDELAELIGDDGTTLQYESLATYFCAKNDLVRGGKFFEKAGEPQKAMNCYMSDGSNQAMDAALALAESESGRSLRDQLLEYLNANMKDQSKGMVYLIRMLIIMQQFEEASIVALKISDQFRIQGEYKLSRELLFDIICELDKHEFPVSSELRQSLMLVHSYLLIKPHREKNNKLIAALLLKRISKYISKFPAHAANLLVMGVVECSRIGMKKSAFEIATKVLQPEYEGRVKPDVLKKIQTTVRRKDLTEIEEEKTKCPVCGVELPISDLYCGNCKSNLPYDTFTGMHMTHEDWCVCPHCSFPASFSTMQQERKCPLCNGEVPNPELVVNPNVVVK